MGYLFANCGEIAQFRANLIARNVLDFIMKIQDGESMFIR